MKRIMTITAIFVFMINSIAMIFAQENPSTELNLTQEQLNQLIEEYGQSTTTPSEEQQLIVYVQEGCLHCKYVEDFIKRYGIESKVEIRDISKNEEYSKEFDNLHVKHGVTQKGTPAMEYNNELLSGDMPIAQVLQQVLDLPEDATSTLYLDATSTDPTSSADMVVIVIGGLVLSAILGFGVYNFVSKENS